MSENPSEPLFSAQQLEAYVRQVMAQERASHAAEVNAVKTQLEAMQKSMAGTVPVLIPEHGGGVGVAIHTTWSMYEQQQAIRDAEEARAHARVAAQQAEEAVYDLFPQTS